MQIRNISLPGGNDATGMLLGLPLFPSDFRTVTPLPASTSGPTESPCGIGANCRGGFPARRTARPPFTPRYLGTWRAALQPRSRALPRDTPTPVQGCRGTDGTGGRDSCAAGDGAAAAAPAEASLPGCASALPGHRQRLPRTERSGSKITGLVPD